MPATASAKPRTTMPGPIVAMSAVAATAATVSHTRNGLRTPAWSAIPPHTGEVAATSTIETETASPHQKSPRPSALPTTRFA